MHNPASGRREFLLNVGLIPVLGSAAIAAIGNESRPSQDPTQPLPVTAADLGTNFQAVEQIAANCRPSVFPNDSLIEFNDEFRRQARAKVREVLSYEPPQTELAPEVIERVDRGDHWIERIQISTTPWF